MSTPRSARSADEPPAGGPEPAPTPLQSAQATERSLREQINDLVTARARAEAEAERLDGRARLAGAEASVAEVGRRYREHAERLHEEIEGLRAELRRQEAIDEGLRADEAGV